MSGLEFNQCTTFEEIKNSFKMKALIYITFIFIFINSYSQIDFQEHIVIDDTHIPNSVREVVASDLDGDGDMDLITASPADNKIAWYENLDGEGTFGLLKIITTEAERADTVYACDIDGDEDMDIISGLAGSNALVWFENIDGLGNFSSQKIISSSANFVISIHANDFDGDGDLDVVSASLATGYIAWHENLDGMGSFGEQKTIRIFDPQVSILKFVYSADLDGDGDFDILSSLSDGDTLFWFENMDGLGNFSSESLITNEISNPTSISVGDMDNDGDIDVLSSSCNDDKIAWYENLNGNGDFGNIKIISTQGDCPESVYPSDIDGDGDLDVISASLKDDKIAWYENIDGLGNFSSEQIITLDADGAICVSSADIDNDGDMDVISASAYDDKIEWHENDSGLGNFTTHEIIFIDTPNGATSTYAVDIDGDNDMDIISASRDDNCIAWYENKDGLGDFGSLKIISNEANWAVSVFATDIDGDGDMDVLSASSNDNKIAWYENTDGLGSFGNQIIISVEASYPKSIYAVDIDDDGDMDVLSASSHFRKIAWYENLDGLGGFSTENILTTSLFRAKDVYAGDIDGDGDYDVVACGGNLPFVDSVVWFENMDGLGGFSPQKVIISDIEEAAEIKTADIDNDGDLDVVVISRWSLIWYENMDGLGAFSDQQIISSDFVWGNSVYCVDIDYDGDVDLISASELDNKIAWYENIDGLGSFSQQQIINSDNYLASSVFSTDIDGDGDMDVISASYGDNKIAWYENLSTLKISENDITKFYIFPNPTIGLFKINSKTKIISIDIYNQLGQKVLFNNQKNNIDISKLSNGIYYIKIKDIIGDIEVHKVIKK